MTSSTMPWLFKTKCKSPIAPSLLSSPVEWSFTTRTSDEKPDVLRLLAHASKWSANFSLVTMNASSMASIAPRLTKT